MPQPKKTQPASSRKRRRLNKHHPSGDEEEAPVPVTVVLEPIESPPSTQFVYRFALRPNQLADSSSSLALHPMIQKLLEKYPLLIITPFPSDINDFNAQLPHQLYRPSSFGSCFRTDLTLYNDVRQHIHDAASCPSGCGELEERDADDSSRRNRHLIDCRPPIDCSPNSALSASASSPLTAMPPFEYLEKQWKALKEEHRTYQPTEGESATFMNRSYANNMGATDFADPISRPPVISGPSSFSPGPGVRNKSPQQRFNPELSFLPATYVSPLHLGRFVDHPLSLARLSDVSWAGGESEYAYLKFGFASFNLHEEQEGHFFYHHQVCGSSVWIVIHPREKERIIPRVIVPIIEARLRVLAAADEESSSPSPAYTSDEILMIATICYRAKRIFPPLSLLKEAKIEHTIVTVAANEILIGWGNLAHCGFGTHGVTLGLACNLITKSWFEQHQGVDQIHAHFMWVKQIRDSNTFTCPKLQQVFKDWKTDLATSLDVAINHCPPNHACALLRGLLGDSRKKKKKTRSAGEADLHITKELRKRIIETICLIHSLREFLKKVRQGSNYEVINVCEETCSDPPAEEEEEEESSSSAPADEEMAAEEEEEEKASSSSESAPVPAAAVANSAGTKRKKHDEEEGEEAEESSIARRRSSQTNPIEENKRGDTSLRYHTSAEYKAMTVAEAFELCATPSKLEVLKELIAVRGMKWLDTRNGPECRGLDWSHIHYAAKSAPATLKWLHEKEATMNQLTYNFCDELAPGSTALHVAIAWRNLESVKYLL
ncbi:MAG: ankyrin repeat domain-containing protein, partial [Candidatus Pacebacteria bacterium]|nr:ankyrin repeat domain-containing protein [Candidatus Paceibacterota bacterium]